MVATLGGGAQQRRAGGLLEKAAAGEDPVLSAFARWCLEHPQTREDVANMFARQS